MEMGKLRNVSQWKLLVFVTFGLVSTGLVSAHAQSPTQDLLRLRAVYSLPLNEQQSARLASANAFEIFEYTVDRTQVGQEKMSLILPRDLTAGESVRVDFQVKSHVEKTRELVSPTGAMATCQGAWVAMTCQFDFRPLKFDLAKSVKFLQTKYGSGPKASQLIELVGLFGNDPIGVGQTTPLAESCVECAGALGLWKIWFRDFASSPGRFTVDLGANEGQVYSSFERGVFETLTFASEGVTGRWKIGAQEGWFRARIKNQKWSGEWGYQNQSQIQGRISGSRP